MTAFDEQIRGLSPPRLALLALELRAELDRRDQAAREPIAIVGMACRFPGGADSPDRFWELLLSGVDAISEVPADRWSLDSYYDPDPSAAGRIYTKYGGFVAGLDRFDSQFFGISPREAASMDPQQRLALEVAWEALEDAGQTGPALAGSATGVFVGACTSDYWLGFGEPTVDTYTGSGNAHSVIANRLSYLLDLRGPSMAIDSACSSSLVALRLACESLRSGECRLALAGGVNAILSPKPYLALSRARMLSADGRCKAFDARADGYVRSEGCGMIVLKRLADAQADHDRIFALVRGTAVNQDGRSNGLTAPNLLAQVDVVRQALANAGISASAVGYVEAHGTGTSLGDPIEIEALDRAIGREGDRPCVIGAVKTNIGHLEAAAGIAGVIKAALCVERGEIPPNLHLQRLNPNITLDRTRFSIATSRRTWPEGYATRCAGVSSFGFAGTNAHVILEQPPGRLVKPDRIERPAHLLCLSAKSDGALTEHVARTAERAAGLAGADLPHLAYSLNTGRGHFSHRLAVVARSTGALAESLRAWRAEDRSGAARSRTLEVGSAAPRIAFLFSGQGAQSSGMVKELFETQALFRATLEDCAALFEPYLDAPLLSVMHDPDEAVRLDQTQYTQPALFAVEYALATLWRSWGIEPAVLLGHSIGELAAACVAGAYTLKDAAALVACRGRLMQSLPAGGAMAAAFGDAEQVNRALMSAGPGAAVAAINGPFETVVSGEAAAVKEACRRLADAGVKTKSLRVSHAFHSPLMDPILDELGRVAGALTPATPRVPVISNVTGDVIPGFDGAYWRRHAREPVRFAAGLDTLAALDVSIAIEIGPSAALSALASRSGVAGRMQWLPSLRPGRSDWTQILETLSTLYLHGTEVNWTSFDREYSRRRIAVPSYPFQRKRYWLAPADPAAASLPVASVDHRTPLRPLIDRRLELPFSNEKRFELGLLPERLAYLRDHRVRGAIVFPAAAHIELALEASAELLGPGGRVLEDFTLSQPLVLGRDHESAFDVQVIARHEADEGSVALRVVATAAGGVEAWTSHAATRAAGQSTVAFEQADLASCKAACPEELDRHAYYEWLSERGLEYGPAFRGIERLWRGEGQALARIHMPSSLSGEGYQIHPALLDAALQVVGAALASVRPDGDQDDLYLPIGVGRLELDAPAPDELWGFATIAGGHDPSSDLVTATLLIFDEAGRRVAVASDARFRRAARPKVVAPPLEESVYDVSWPETPPDRQYPVEAGQGQWLIFADGQGVGAALAETLCATGGRCVLVTAGSTYVERSADEVTLDPGRVEHFARLLERTPGASWRGAVHLWNLDHPHAPDPDALRRAQLNGCGSLLHLAQAAGETRPLRLWVATAGAQPAGESRTVAPLQAAAWGLGRVIAQERPGSKIVLVDLDPAASPVQAAAAMAVEMCESGREAQVAWRADVRHAARLQRRPRASIAYRPPADAESYRLDIRRRGVLDELAISPAHRSGPAAGEVEIRVTATGLNFRDVLNALGLYPGDPGPLGLECAGTISAVGDAVEDLHVGQPVIAVAPASFSRYVTTAAAFVVPRPPHLKDEEAATLPVTFLTALYALRVLARIRPGDRVLIHAAAGGVGLAAIQVARRAGAAVFATAGSERKRGYLESLGIQHISDSRSERFVHDIRTWAPEGIDVVLNSLAAGFVPASLSLLREGGRFIEIGKTAEWNLERVAEVRPDVFYRAFDLGQEAIEDPGAFHALFADLMADIIGGRFEPLPVRVFPLREVVGAFRFMAQTRHIGKVVVSHPQSEDVQPSRPTFRSDASYLVTGGIGTLGMRVAAWAVANGAQRLWLVSRHEPSARVRAIIDELARGGAEINTTAIDVADRQAVASLLSTIDRSGAPLRGVIHAAGVLDDGVVASQTWDRFERVMSPKVTGAWNLHVLTDQLPLDFCVYFSSLAGVVGSPGQGSYAAANAALDALAQHRRAAGHRALSVSWGVWSGGGMAGTATADAQRRWRAQGIGMIRPDEGLELLGELMAQGGAHAVVAPIDWQKFRRASSAGVTAFFEDLFSSGPDEPQGTERAATDVLAVWRAAPSHRRRGLILAAVRSQVAAALGLDAEAGGSARQPLGELGLDSLMAVEIRNALGLRLGLSLPATLLFDHPTIESLAEYLDAQIFGETQPREANSADVLPGDLDDVLTTVEQMSDRDVEAAFLSRPKV